jgi:hypothetical protein
LKVELPVRGRYGRERQQHGRRARPHELVVVGADRPDGRVAGGQSRLNAVVLPPGSRHHARRLAKARPATRTLSTNIGSGAGPRVVYSVELPDPRRGDRVLALGAERVAIGRLPYNVYLRSQLILAGSPTATAPGRLGIRSGILGGALTPANGFNCTRGRSGYRTPCTSRKAGMTALRRTPRSHAGRWRPLYVNLVSRAQALLATPQDGDAVRVVRGGYLNVLVLRTR